MSAEKRKDRLLSSGNIAIFDVLQGMYIGGFFDPDGLTNQPLVRDEHPIKDF